MSMGINTNITAMIGQQNLNESKSALTTSMERLSSGLRINSAKDDAAGQAIANRMTAQISGLGQAQRNANDGISIAQTAEGGLNQINDNLQRVRELTVQAANGTNSQDDLQSIQDEVNQRLAEIDRISKETDFNGTRVLSDSAESLDIQVGSEDGQTISVNLATTNSASLKLDQFRVTENALNASDTVEFVQDDAGYEQADLSQAGTSLSALLGESVNVNDLTLREVQAADGTGGGTGQFAIEYKGDFYMAEGKAATSSANAENFTVAAVNVDGADQAVKIGINRDSGGNLTNTGYVERDDGSFTQVGLSNAAGTPTTAFGATTSAQVVTGSGATLGGTGFTGAATTNPLEKLDEALSQVDSLRSELGAVQNRFESAISNLSTNETNLSAARSRIEDADYATEVADMTKNQILQQAGTSVLSQANQLPQSVLSLLG